MVVVAPESDSAVSCLITPLPELLPVKLKKLSEPPLLYISNEKSHRAETLAVDTVSSKCKTLFETEGEGEVNK